MKQLCSTYKVAPADLVVIHDAADIDPGTVRVKFGGGLAGHNGLKSIADKLQTKDGMCVRAGIGLVRRGRMPVADWVLSLPKKEARDDFDQATHSRRRKRCCRFDNGLEKNQQKFN